MGISATNSPFINLVFKEKQNRRLAIIAGSLITFQFIIFKLLYPFADFFSDSYSYIEAASLNMDVSIWPIGYSKFLKAFHELTHSDTALVGFQYFFLELSALYFFFSILYFYSPGKTTRNILFIFLFLNPLFLYISNYINSDPLFAALSLFWFTQLILIIHRPHLSQIAVQAILLFLCFTVRNNAYYYPFIALFAFILSSHRFWAKVAGIILPLVFIIPFILHTQSVAEEMTGKKQFSLFTGWQLANNALYMYGHIQVDSTKLPTVESRELNQLSQKFYSKMPPDFSNYLSEYVANFFIRQPQSPLKVYFGKHYRPKDGLEGAMCWGKASIIYSDFGKYLIQSHPAAYFRYFVLLNTKNYFLPPLEKLEEYNLGDDEVQIQAQDWFDYKTTAVNSVSKNAQGSILFLFPYIFLFLNILFVGSLIWFFINKGQLKVTKEFSRVLLLTTCFVIANFVFCITATILVLRYEFFPMLVLLALPLVTIDLLDKQETITSNPQKQSGSQSTNLKFEKSIKY